MEIHYNMPFKNYQKQAGLSNSQMNKINISPAFFKWSEENPQEKTEALIFGSLLHGLVLEPQNFERDFIVMPNVDKRTRAGKEVMEQFDLACEDRQIVTQEQFDLACILRDKVMSHEIAKKLLTGKGENEVSIFWEDDGVECKGRPDRIKDRIIIDLKTTTSTKPEEFSRNAYKYGYHRQCAWYSKGYEKAFNHEPLGFVFIAIEKTPPYDVVVFGTTELFKSIGEIETKKLLNIYKDCQKTGNWYGKEGEKPKVVPLDLPQSILNKYLEDLDG